MTSKAIDKENSSSFGNLLLSNTKGLGLGTNPKSFNTNQLLKNEKINSTPVMEKKSLLNKEILNTTGKQRRALGDVLNTAPSRQNAMGLGITPKGDRKFQIENTPSGKLAKSFAKNLKLNELQQQVYACKKDAQEEELPPVEHFIGSKYDNFDDLFNDGRLSELFLMADSTKFSSNLNQRGFSYNQDVEERIIIDNDNDENDLFEVELKKVKKSLKKMTKKCELKSQEIECLDDLMPKICEDSFEDL